MSVTTSDADTALKDATLLDDGDSGALVARALGDVVVSVLTKGDCVELALAQSDASRLTLARPVPIKVAGGDGVAASDDDTPLLNEGAGSTLPDVCALLAAAVSEGVAATLAERDETALTLALVEITVLSDASPVPTSVTGGDGVACALAEAALLGDCVGAALLAAGLSEGVAAALPEGKCSGLTVAVADAPPLALTMPVPTSVLGGDGVGAILLDAALLADGDGGRVPERDCAALTLVLPVVSGDSVVSAVPTIVTGAEALGVPPPLLDEPLGDAVDERPDERECKGD